MKLVEILARNIAYWPERIHAMEQCAMGEIIEAGNNSRVFCVTDKADYPDIVTRTQWQAERDRMKAMGTQQATASTEPTYEQQLWDRVAVAATQAFITGHITHFGHENVWQDKELVSCASDYADAFMAERAKRVGK